MRFRPLVKFNWFLVKKTNSTGERPNEIMHKWKLPNR